MQARKTTGARDRKAIKEGKRPRVAKQEEAAKKFKEDLEEKEKMKWVDKLKSKGSLWNGKWTARVLEPTRAKLDKKTLEGTLTNDPKSVKKGKFVWGKLRDLYRVINKVVHYNLHPHGSEKKPSARDGKILYVFGKDDEKVDWSKWIWGEMKKFREKGTQRGNIPFPVMVTKLCADAEVEPKAGDVLITTGFTKAITRSSLTKSKKMSKPPKAATIATSRPMGTRPSKRTEVWMEIISNQYTIIQKGQARIETQLRRSRRENAKTIRKLDYLVEKKGEETEDPYVQTEEDLKGDTEEEGGESEENEERGKSEEDDEED
ncbi:hypothetical protein RHSIM_Rhsim03G0124700 [Rhododendron simsii]|uniref:Uncharacterized protein n=1 Tax=Rhododendron simsii TaxID=118357 RepID=A0A834HJG6_RHOSS|nr:hypothetical protein RHSIM_Rhsim03G0124700 [Rhododendron simsii]